MRNLYAAIRPVQRHFRTRRMATFARALSITPTSRVLDVGGTGYNWELCPVRPRVTLLNRYEEPDFPVPRDMTLTVADGCALPFGDQSFDVVYSNSVVEHVGDWTRQQQFAREIQRVGRAYYVQTPAKAFPLEPHLLTPAIHWLPRPIQRRLLPFTAIGLLHRGDRPIDFAWYDDVRLLERREVRALFPEATLMTERVLGLPKSYIAIGRHNVP
jgi:hypothetical protein